GSIAIELVLWLLFCLPGIIYSVWRLTARKKVCPVCNSDALVPENSPRGRQLLAELRTNVRQQQPPPSP
ncbi:MAG TPA: hypothetical protein VK530_01545, partial [Candidatus Acidoferrum sp.]|nr:hypothetical protein [Candidatus Acidoferrum sp.]